MTSLWFVVPAHGRHELTAICLRQLRDTCDRLDEIEATAVVISDDENLDTARSLGFGTIERNNQFLSRRFNDGIQLATDPGFNHRPADYVVPCGSDDWVHPSLFEELPSHKTMIGFQQMCFVREDGLEMTARSVAYQGGCGIRIYPRWLMEQVGYRPADEDRRRGCDTSTLHNLQANVPGMRVQHRASEPWAIVDWKSPDEQVNAYGDLARHRALWTGDPWVDLDAHYPLDLIAEMHSHYLGRMVTA